MEGVGPGGAKPHAPGGVGDGRCPGGSTVAALRTGDQKRHPIQGAIASPAPRYIVLLSAITQGIHYHELTALQAMKTHTFSETREGKIGMQVAPRCIPGGPNQDKTTGRNRQVG